MHNIPFGKPLIGPEEKEAVLKVMDGLTLVHEYIAEFRRILRLLQEHLMPCFFMYCGNAFNYFALIPAQG